MKSVAQHLGVDHSSLYRHLHGRDALVLAAVEAAIDDLDWRPDEDMDWRPFLEALALAVWRLFRTHPGLAEALRALEILPPSGLRIFAEAVARLEDRGFARDTAILVLDSIMDMTLDSAVGWRRLSRSTPGERSLAERVGADWSALAEATPAVGAQLEAIARVLSGDPEGWWRRKLALLLDGAEAGLARGD
jgi:AcrR family transcriptional regulator